jgi:hypothetical protein
MRRHTVLFPMLVLLIASAARADVPALSDVQQLFKRGDFAGVVKGCADALAPGGATDPVERFKFASIKGDAHLKLRQADEAVDAFTAAAKETEDARQSAIARATIILIGRSQEFIYTSQTIKPPPARVPQKPPANSNAPTSLTTNPAINTAPVVLPRGQFDIIDSLHRPDALAAMWTDEKADAEKTIKDKIATKALPALNDALDRIHAAEPIAIAGGAADWPQTEKTQLANAARVDANVAMKDMNTQLITITKDQTKRRNKQRVQAMPQGQRDQLNTMIEAINQIVSALKALPEALGIDKGTYATQLEQAANLEDKATTVLATD